MGIFIGRSGILAEGVSIEDVSRGVSVQPESVAESSGAKGASTARNSSTSGRGGAIRTKIVCPGSEAKVPSASMADFKGAGS